MPGVLHKIWTDAKGGTDEKKLFKEDLGKKLDAFEDAVTAFDKKMNEARAAFDALMAAKAAAHTTVDSYITEANKPANRAVGDVVIIPLGKLTNYMLRGMKFGPDAIVDLGRLRKGQDPLPNPNTKGAKRKVDELRDHIKAGFDQLHIDG